MNQVCRFKFSDNLTKGDIETQLALAITAAECTYGRARVRISAAYFIAKDRPAVVVDVSTEVGEYIAQAFTELMTRLISEENFTVERVLKQD
ncbi:hypothetical protein ACFL2Z_00615 [Candidatus Eisenbacteria bacterium]|uniref:Uncharacterized protein n=1 Tax=Eiseniibacteriota bacterium TaxID=2212470 RepID=A0ABV6YMW3_UNCEI